jgi:hypothetical protein
MRSTLPLFFAQEFLPIYLPMPPISMDFGRSCMKSLWQVIGKYMVSAPCRDHSRPQARPRHKPGRRRMRVANPLNSRMVRPALLLGACALLAGADAPTGGEAGVRTFVLSNIYMANGGEQDRCEAMSDGALEAFLASLPAEERARYATPDKRGELMGLMAQRLGFRRLGLRRGDFGGRVGAAKLPDGLDPSGPITPAQALEIGRLNGFPAGRGRLAYQKQTVAYSSCTNPEDFPQLAKGFHTYGGKIAAGIDLDGKVGRNDLTAPDGSRGVDNQLWRAAGCVRIFRESSEPRTAKKIFISARAPTLIEVRGIDDATNDPEVTVNIYAAADPVVRDARGEALARASFTLDPDPTLRATVRGRIENGVLTTEPADLRFNYKEQIIDAPRFFRAARIRATFKPDGSIEGGVYGYYDLASFYDSIEQMTQNGADLSGVSCPGVRQAIDRLADGYKDRRTGRYTAISSAYQFFGVPAFVIRDERAFAARAAAPGNGS